MELTTTAKTMSSREIADLTGSTHDNVLKTVRSLVERGVISGNETPYVHPQNGQTYSFMDLFLQIQASRSFSVRLTGLNLMDMRQYRQQHLIAYGMQQVSAMLQGRKLQLTCSVNF